MTAPPPVPTALPDLQGYFEHGIETVPGWFNRLDATMFLAVDALQEERGIAGDLMEIGVYQGRSAILIDYMARDTERVIVCDIFESTDEIGSANQAEFGTLYENLQRSQFEAQYVRFRGALPEIIQAPSDAIDRAKYEGRLRFLHIDGSHTYDVVVEDIKLARRLLGPGGVVVFDDWSQPNYAGVGLAVWEEFLRGELIPLGLTNDKFYATWDPQGLTADELEHWGQTSDAVIVSSPLSLRCHVVCRFTPGPALTEFADATQGEPAERTDDEVVAPAVALPPRITTRRVIKAFTPPVALTAYRALRARARQAAGR